MTRVLRARRRPADERGFTIVEVLVALMVFAVVAAGLATSVGGSLKLQGRSTSRQAATQLASSWLEEGRGTDYDSGLGLPADTVFDTTTEGNPDLTVTGSPKVYNGEEIVFVGAGQGLNHRGSDTVNGRDFEIYRYVTWVPDDTVSPAEPRALKRVTVVVQWIDRDTPGTLTNVTVSTLVSDGAIGWTQSATTTVLGATTTSSSTTTTAPAPTTTLDPGACSGDPPSGSIRVDTVSKPTGEFVRSNPILILLNATVACGPMTVLFQNESGSWSGGTPYGTTANWTTSSGDGPKTVSVKFVDANGQASGTATASFVMDSTAPATPSKPSVSNTGKSKITVSWPATSDTYLGGYRVYRSVNGGAFQNTNASISAPCNPCSFVDNGVAKKNSYTYYVVAFDDAGNVSTQSPSTTPLTL